MMMKQALTATLLLCLLAGCDSGSDDSVQAPEAPQPAPEVSPYLTLNVTPDARFEGQFEVYLGRYDDRLKAWLQSARAQDRNSDGHIDERDAHLDGVRNPPERSIVVQADEMDRLLKTNPDGLGAGSARPDIFVDGHYGIFDALRYLAVTRADLRLDSVSGPEATGRDTFDFVLSWDRNHDGVFDERDNDLYSNFQGQHWHSRIRFDGGELITLNGTLDGVGPQGEGHYERLDQMWIQPGMTIRFQPFSPEMTKRRHWVQQREMTRLAQSGGKVVLPRLMVMKSETTPPIVIDNLEVTAHNMRPDIFQPGVITKMDIFLSAADQGLDVAFNYWPSLSTGAPVNHFGLFRVDGLASEVARGWTTLWGEMVTDKDFGPLSDCDFSSAMGGGQDLVVNPEHCRVDWQSAFGGTKMHIMSDVWVMNQAEETAIAIFADHYQLFGMEEFSGKRSAERDFSPQQDGADIVTLQVFELPQAGTGPTLSSAHFGWGIADCTECHNEQKQPLGHGGHSWPVNSVDGFDVTQPYYCATCHGSNGAPVGHGETARCFWCHAGDSNTPGHHGEASTRKLYQGGDIISNDKIYNSSHGGVPDPNDPNDLSVLPRDKDGNYSEYRRIWSSVNSDWDMSRVFPDPYSCMTCHPNQ
ncbi:hypothetical protein [Ferrimonas sp. SCSIO 43195]|uniref:hypothetical protein n=1 Tax=Ferrimonas sp. SCSIO 43195 TaxID=2822844 RepID=UPI002075D68F|nr:hypothetical protein [Ferrimonas sp. SCSIO 43195]USD36116.1 hypothetical protein J8Z22_13845 [Ferrimonas sp. SCSIO 43195]